MYIKYGLRQGSTGSAILFKLITYTLEQIEYTGKGFSNEEVNIGALFLHMMDFLCDIQLRMQKGI